MLVIKEKNRIQEACRRMQLMALYCKNLWYLGARFDSTLRYFKCMGPSGIAAAAALHD